MASDREALAPVERFSKLPVSAWAERHLRPAGAVVFDGLSCFTCVQVSPD